MANNPNLSVDVTINTKQAEASLKRLETSGKKAADSLSHGFKSPDTHKLTEEFQELGKSMLEVPSGMSGIVGSLGSLAGPVGIAVGALALLGEFLHGAAEKGLELEKSNARLEGSFAHLGPAAEGAVSSIKLLGEELEQHYHIEAELADEAAAKFSLNTDANVEQIKKLTEFAAALGFRTGKSMDDASTLIEKAYNSGKWEKIDKILGTHIKSWEDIQDAIDKTDEATEATQKTMSFALDGIKVSWDNLLKSVGIWLDQNEFVKQGASATSTIFDSLATVVQIASGKFEGLASTAVNAAKNIAAAFYGMANAVAASLSSIPGFAGLSGAVVSSQASYMSGIGFVDQAAAIIDSHRNTAPAPHGRIGGGGGRHGGGGGGGRKAPEYAPYLGQAKELMASDNPAVLDYLNTYGEKLTQQKIAEDLLTQAKKKEADANKRMTEALGLTTDKVKDFKDKLNEAVKDVSDHNSKITEFLADITKKANELNPVDRDREALAQLDKYIAAEQLVTQVTGDNTKLRILENDKIALANQLRLDEASAMKASIATLDSFSQTISTAMGNLFNGVPNGQPLDATAGLGIRPPHSWEGSAGTSRAPRGMVTCPQCNGQKVIRTGCETGQCTQSPCPLCGGTGMVPAATASGYQGSSGGDSPAAKQANPIEGTFWSLADGWASGETQGFRQAIPGAASQLLSGLVPGPAGNFLGLLAGRLLGGLFDKHKSQPLQPIPVKVVNFADIASSLLNVTKNMLTGLTTNNINSINNMRLAEAKAF